ncbi:MAG TPA: aspartyl protease family protein [Vicinamibacteria bacterium]|jgi:predicted aspartyl protease
MELRRGFCVFAACLLVPIPSFAADEAPPELPFDLGAGNFLLVRGSIGRLERLRFLIDTGATRTLIDKRIARKLGLTLVPRTGQLWALDHAGEAWQTVVPSLQFGPIRIESASGLVADLSGFRGLGPIDAVIGLDLLRQGSFQIDYGSRRITFGPLPDSTESVSFQTLSPLLSVDATIERRPVRLMVDTAGSRLILFSDRMGSRLPRFRYRGRTSILGALGTSRVDSIDLADVRLGETTVPGGDAVLLDGAAAPYAGLDGVLGALSRSLKRVGFDFARNRLQWEK